MPWSGGLHRYRGWEPFSTARHWGGCCCLKGIRPRHTFASAAWLPRISAPQNTTEIRELESAWDEFLQWDQKQDKTVCDGPMGMTPRPQVST